MLNVWGTRREAYCNGLSRRDLLQVGALGLAGLGLADLLRLRAQAEPTVRKRPKSVIMIVLPGGPSHVDLWDMKPDASSEIRGEFRPIGTRVPGTSISELLPLEAKITDKFSIVRGIKSFSPDHIYNEVATGFPASSRRPAFGSVVSRLKATADAALPPFVALRSASAFNNLSDVEQPQYLGVAHRPFVPDREGLASMKLNLDMPLDRMQDRRQLMASFDRLRAEVDLTGNMAGWDSFTLKAFDMINTPQVRDAFDVSREPQSVRSKYGLPGEYIYYGAGPHQWPPSVFLQALRLAEAGVPVITLSIGHWDHHTPPVSLFHEYRIMLPHFDRSYHALISDLYDRGLQDDVAVLVWGEFGRTPKINPQAGRDHWPDAGCALLAGAGLRPGIVVGETDSQGQRSKGVPYTPQNVLATLYHVLGIDPRTTLNDFNGRPVALLDDPEPIAELL